MLKNISRLECIVNDKVFHFLCDMDSSIETVKEALSQFQKYTILVEDAVKAAQQQIQPNQKQEENKDCSNGKPSV